MTGVLFSICTFQMAVSGCRIIDSTDKCNSLTYWSYMFLELGVILEDYNTKQIKFNVHFLNLSVVFRGPLWSGAPEKKCPAGNPAIILAFRLQTQWKGNILLHYRQYEGSRCFLSVDHFVLGGLVGERGYRS